LDYTKAIESNPSYAVAYYNRGVVYANKNQLNEALVDFNKATELAPQYADVYFNKAVIYEKTGRIKEAIETYKLFIQYAPPQYGTAIERAKGRIKELEK
jgi:tetratricopeptide (TPR) repeat protein